jgi:hypothetical protein
LRMLNVEAEQDVDGLLDRGGPSRHPSLPELIVSHRETLFRNMERIYRCRKSRVK